jgi:hypothetical protein
MGRNPTSSMGQMDILKQNEKTNITRKAPLRVLFCCVKRLLSKAYAMKQA